MIDVHGAPSKFTRSVNVLSQVVRKQDVSRLESCRRLEGSVNICMWLIPAEKMRRVANLNGVERITGVQHLLPVHTIRVAEARDADAKRLHFLKQFTHPRVVTKDPGAVDAVDLVRRVCSTEGVGNCRKEVRM